MTLSVEDFISGVTKNFMFLTDHSFHDIGFERTPSKRGYYYFYSNKHLTIRIHCSLTNEWIDVDFIYESNATSLITNWDNSISLMTLFAFKKLTGYELIMPKSLGFNDSIFQVGQKTKELGEDILDGFALLTTNDVLNYFVNINRCCAQQCICVMSADG